MAIKPALKEGEYGSLQFPEVFIWGPLREILERHLSAPLILICLSSKEPSATVAYFGWDVLVPWNELEWEGWAFCEVGHDGKGPVV